MAEVDVFERYLAYIFCYRENQIKFDFLKMEYDDPNDLTINDELEHMEEYKMLRRLMKLKRCYENKLITNNSELEEFSTLKKKYERLCEDKG